jgi:signal transduction histidine kinase/CheY-like chemotaxis protein
MGSSLLNSATGLILCASCIFFSLLMYQSNRDTPGTAHWSAGTALFACGLLFLSWQSFTPPWISIVLANLFLLLGMLFELTGTLLFFNKKPIWWPLLTSIVLVCLGLLHFTYIQPDNNTRIIIFSLAYVAFKSSVLVVLYLNRGQHFRVAMRLFNVTIGLGLVVMSYRAAITYYPEYLGGDKIIKLVHQLVAGLPFFICCAMLLGFFLLCNERQLHSIKKLQQFALQQAESKKKLLAFLSHEFRTPLNAIVGKAQLLAKQLTDPIAQYDCQLIADAGKSLSLINQQILRQAEVDHSGINNNTSEIIELRFWLSRFIDTYQHLATTKGLTLTHSVTSTAPKWVEINSIALRQILTNLLANAIKYSDTGEINIAIESIDINEEYRFMISDQGVGIHEQEQQHALKPFNRAWQSMQQEGSGLGLALTQQLLHSMGAELNFTSKHGVGSCFYFTLQLVTAKEKKPNKTANYNLQTNQLHILVVEDIPLNQQVISGMLNYLAVKHTITETLGQAAQLLKSQLFDLLLLDLNLPDGNGLDFFITMKKNNLLLPDTCILTANIILETEQACLDAGVKAILHKPVELEKLQQVINQLVNSKPILDSKQFWQLARFMPKTKLKQHLETLDSDFYNILQQLSTGDISQNKTLVHKLAGKAATLGMTKLAHICDKLEKNNTDLHYYLPQLQQLCNQATSLLRQEISEDL